jgi:hypothetical protein
MSVWQYALGVALASSTALWPVRRARPWNALVATGVPVVLASFVYWFEAFVAAQDADQYAAWAPGIIGMLAAPGALAGLVIAFAAERSQARRSKT